MRDLFRLAAHIAGIALTISLIPLAAALMLTSHQAWGAACLAAALAAVWLAARLDHRAHGTKRDPVDEHFADTARALNTPTMRRPAAPPAPPQPWFPHTDQERRKTGDRQ